MFAVPVLLECPYHESWSFTITHESSSPLEPGRWARSHCAVAPYCVLTTGREVNLGHNQLEGSIKDGTFSMLTALSVLDLAGNSMSYLGDQGPLPSLLCVVA